MDNAMQDALQIDLAEAQRYLKILDPETDEFTFQTFDDSDEKRTQLTRIFHGTFKQYASVLSRLNERGAGIFVTINKTDLRGRKTENITKVRKYCLDTDGAPIEPIIQATRAGKIMPSCLVESSPGNAHIYWDADCELADFKPVQSLLAKKFGTDTSVHDLPRVLRLPGFFHQKRKSNAYVNESGPFQVRIIKSWDNASTYTPGEMIAGLDLEIVKANAPRTLPSNLTLGANLKAPPTPETQDEIERVKSMLGAISADCNRDQWMVLVWAVASLNWHCGEDLAREWSASAPGKFDETAFQTVWKTYKPDGGIGFGTLVHFAKAGGWIAHTSQSQSQTDDEIIRQLASLNSIEYDRVRKEQATALRVQVKTLDAMVKAERNDEGKASRFPFDEIEPHTKPIDPAQLLSELSDTIQQFIVLDTEQAHAVALWIALTHFIDVVEVAPLAIINAPEKSCGKTQLLTVMGRMAYRPLPASNATASALFRAVELWKPTILIDEADTFFRDNFELHGMVNAGHLRDGYVLRSEAVGDSFEPRMFSVFSAKALAGIALEKHLSDATMSRGIVFNLRRKLSHESVSRLRHADRKIFTAIAKKLARFAADYSQQVRLARLDLPDALSDRDQDNWEPLLAIASCAGDDWLTRATAAALKLSGTGEKTGGIGNELLADIQHVFESKKLDKIKTADLIAALCHDEEGAWAAYNRGKQITPRQFARLLKPYGIASKSIRVGNETPKGFELSQFTDAFGRYLSTPPEFAATSATCAGNQ